MSINLILIILLGIIFGIIIPARIAFYNGKKTGENNIKYKNLEEEIDNFNEINKIKENFNNFSYIEQSNWLFKYLKSKRNKINK